MNNDRSTRIAALLHRHDEVGDGADRPVDGGCTDAPPDLDRSHVGDAIAGEGRRRHSNVFSRGIVGNVQFDCCSAKGSEMFGVYGRVAVSLLFAWLFGRADRRSRR